jgi:hypothetical protein
LFERLAERLSSQKSKGAKVVVALTIALILVSIGLLMQLVDFGSFFDPPYPSEETPLTLVELDRVSWSIPYNEWWDDHPYDGVMNYSEIAFCIQYSAVDEGTTGIKGFLVNETEQALLSSGSPAHLVVDGSALRQIEVVEYVGDGVFGPGDSIVFDPSSFVYPNDPDRELVFTIGLIYVRSGTSLVEPIGEYSYAVLDGEFYSWHSNELDWRYPWYHTLLDD